MSLPFPARIGPFLPERLLGRGAMATVYLARDAAGEPVALKWLDNLHPPVVRRFLQEGAALARLSHPGIVGFRGAGEADGRPWVALEFVDGVDLRVYAEKLHKRPPHERYARCRTVGVALCEALEHLHAAGLVHRDIKPANVLVAHDGAVKLSDLGVVKMPAAAAEETASGLLVGTPAWCAPEQLRGDPVDLRADLFSLGATLSFLLTLRRPFEGLDRRPDTAPVLPGLHDPDIPADLEATLQRLLHEDPASRFASAGDAARALASGHVEAVSVAGRQLVVDSAIAALDRAATGRPLRVQVLGPRGSGRAWLAHLVEQGARRRGLPVQVSWGDDAADTTFLAVGGGRVLIARKAAQAAAPVETVSLLLEPLGMADVRRTLVAAAPLTADPAAQAERLHRASGGSPALLLALLERYVDAQALRLPTEPHLRTVADDWIATLDPDERELVGALALSDEPLPAAVLDAVLPAPAESLLPALAARGLVRGTGDRWALAAGVFRKPVIAALPDAAGLGARLAAARGAPAGPAAVHAQLAEAAAARLDGRPALALASLEAAAGLAHTLGDPALEVSALLDQGALLLDLGAFEPARRRLADATALARAADLGPARRVAHALRAWVDLRERPAARSAAAAALDRLLSVVAGGGARPPERGDALAHAALSLAAGLLGDRAGALRHEAEATRRLGALPVGEAAEVAFALAFAAATSGEGGHARDRLDLLAADPGADPLLRALGRRLGGALTGAPTDAAPWPGLDAELAAAWAALPLPRSTTGGRPG